MRTNPMPTSVFISHSSADRDIANAARESLEAAGIRCWIAPRDVRGGRFYPGEIIRAIRRSKVFLLIFSEAANASDQVLQELERATHLKIPILAIRLGAVTPSDSFAYFLGIRHWVEPARSSNGSVDFRALPQQVGALLPPESGTPTGPGSAMDRLSSAGDQRAEKMTKRKPKARPVRWLLGAALCFAGVLLIWFLLAGRWGSLFERRVPEAGPPEKSIAVLPFENISPSKDDAYFADGVHDEILNNLAKIAQLKVISRTSVMQYRPDGKRDLRQIARALGVGNVLEGTVRRDGNRIRVSTELIDASNDKTIWADSYDRDLTDIFGIQSEVAPP